MNTKPGTLESLVIEISKVFYPLLDDLKPSRAKVFFAQIGVSLSDGQVNSLSTPLSNSVSKISQLLSIVSQLIEALDDENYTEVTLKGIEAIPTIKDIIDEFVLLADAIANEGIPDSITNKLPERIFNYLLANHIDNAPGINSGLELLGILEREDFNIHSVDLDNPPFTISSYKFGEIGNWLSNPKAQMESLYDWGSNSFDGIKLFELMEKAFSHMNFPVLYIDTPSPKLDIVFVELVAKTDINPKGLLLKFKNTLSSGSQSLTQGDVTIEFNVDFQPPENTGLVFQPDGTLFFQPPDNIAINGNFDLKLIIKQESEPYILFGEAEGNRFEMEEIVISSGTKVNWSGTEATGELEFQTAVNGLKLQFDGSKGDGFISKLLGDIKVEADFDLLMGVSSERGFYFGGSSALEVRIPTHLELGPVTLEGITIALKLKDGKIPVTTGVDIKAELGPLVAVVQNIGIISTFSFPDDNSGNLGPLQMDIGFKPPNGIGLSLDTGVIKGGGFLYLDFDKGEYFGALELSLQNTFALKAIGIINTKMPDGSDGFAMLILITAEFTPIQLSYGFTLNGVGGLLALNRSTDLDALRTGVRTGAVSSILFPKDIVANITRIISDLKSVFPIVEAHFIIAPMGKIGWGTPTLISLEIGIILDIPKPAFVIIGVLRCILPTEEAAILKLQVNFAGGIDFNAGLIWFDASLFDSSLLVFTLSGDMALRIGWNDPVFVISVGGFHPAFNEVPSDLVGMKRIMLSLLSGENPRLNAQIYFAITSNTIQSGAKVELYAAAAGFNIYGYLGYDLLVQFNPFYFIAQIYAGLALRSGTSVLAGLSVRCELSGPTPWNANGEASLKILFFKITVGFNTTWGEDAPTQPLETEDVLQLVLDALEDDRNWKADFPNNTNLTVTLKQIELAENKIIVHPFGILSASQKVVPLDLDINKFGNKKPLDDTRFSIEYTGSREDVKEEFAIANFQKLDDSKKLSRKSFEKMKSGLKFATGDATHSGNIIQKEVNYEMSYIHKKTTLKAGLMKMFNGIFNILIEGSDISKNTFSVSKKIANNAPAEVAVANPGYSVVNVSDLELHEQGLTASTEAEAYGMYDNLIKNDPSLQGSIQVVSEFEM